MCGCVWVPVAWTVRVRGCTYTHTHTVAALRPLPSLHFPLFFSVFLFVGWFVSSPFLRSAFVSLPLPLKEQKHARDKPPRSPYSTHPTHHRADTRSWDMHAHSPPPLSANCARTDEGEKAHTHIHTPALPQPSRPRAKRAVCLDEALRCSWRRSCLHVARWSTAASAPFTG